MVRSNSLYDAAVETSREYLGPAGERFIRRQITMHLNIEPEKLAANDLAQLVDWIKLAFAMLTDNQEHIESFASELLSLSHQPIPSSRR